MKKWYASKLVWVGLLTFVFGGSEALAGADILSDEAKDAALMIAGGLTVLIRLFTGKEVS